MGSLITVAAVPVFEDGTYVGKLTSIEKKTIEPKQGSQAGQKVDIFEWRFSLKWQDGTDLVDEETGEPIVGRATSSLASGPRSKLSGFLVALLGPQAVEPGAQYDAEDLVGKRAMVTLVHDEGGYPKVEALSAMPKTRKTIAAKVVEEEDEEEAPAPASKPAPAPAAENEDDDLPF